MKALKKALIIAMVLVIVLGCLAGCAKEEKTTLIMATNAAFPPYEFKGDNGEFEGIDIEISEAIADKLGLTLQIEDVDFGAIIGGVQTGKYDMGAAGMTVNEERKKSVDFTDSYATGIQVVIVKEDSAITDIDTIASTGAIIGVQQDTTGDIYASDTPDNGGFGEDKVVRYKTGADAVQALITDKVGCVIIDNEPAKAFVAANTGLKILETEYVEEQYAICVSKDNSDLLAKINTALAELKSDGTLQAIVDKYIKAE